MTIAGQYIKPKPIPITQPTEPIRYSTEVAKYDAAQLK